VNVREQVVLPDPTSLDERSDVASLCVRNLGIELPAVVDEADNRIEQAYTAWPDRLYLIDREGRVAYKSAPGPFGFKPHELEQALRRVRRS
jgi:type I thyroxine 5'-deiodinase